MRVYCCRVDCGEDPKVMARCDRKGCKNYLCVKHCVTTRYRFELCPSCYEDYVKLGKPANFCETYPRQRLSDRVRAASKNESDCEVCKAMKAAGLTNCSYHR